MSSAPSSVVRRGCLDGPLLTPSGRVEAFSVDVQHTSRPRAPCSTSPGAPAGRRSELFVAEQRGDRRRAGEPSARAARTRVRPGRRRVAAGSTAVRRRWSRRSQDGQVSAQVLDRRRTGLLLRREHVRRRPAGPLERLHVASSLQSSGFMPHLPPEVPRSGDDLVDRRGGGSQRQGLDLPGVARRRTSVSAFLARSTTAGGVDARRVHRRALHDLGLRGARLPEHVALPASGPSVGRRRPGLRPRWAADGGGVAVR